MNFILYNIMLWCSFPTYILTRIVFSYTSLISGGSQCGSSTAVNLNKRSQFHCIFTMTLFSILTSLLFVVAIVHADIDNIDENDIDSYQNQAEQQFLAYGVNSEISEKMADLFFDFARRTEKYCKTQSQTVLDDVQNSYRILLNCGETIFKTQKEEESDPWKFVCQRKPMFMKCLKDFTTTVDACILDEDKYMVDFVNNFVDSIFSFGCSDDGKRIFDMVEQGNYPRCFKDRKEQEAHIQCMNTGMLRRTLAAKYLKNIATFNAADCRDFEGIFECMKNNLKNCRDDRVIPMLTSIHKAADGITHCSKGGSVAGARHSSASIVAVYLQFLLLPALIASF